MLCLKAEALWGEMYVSHGAILPVNLGGSIHSAMQRGVREKGGGIGGYGAPDLSSSSSSGDKCSRFEETKGIHGLKVESGGKMGCYRSQLEEEIQILEKQLQEEIDLHVALANAVGNTMLHLSRPPSKLPNKAQELLASIDALEITVRMLEEELFALNFSLRHERRECRAAEFHLEYIQMPSPAPPSSTSGYIWEEHVSSLRMSKLGLQAPPSIHLNVLPSREDLQSVRGPAENIPMNEVVGSCNGGEERRNVDSSSQLPVFAPKDLKVKNLWALPNQLSEEMVLCMRNIFLRLSRSPTSASKAPLSKWLSSLSSAAGNLYHSSSTSLSDSSRLASSMKTSSELIRSYEVMDQEDMCDPYGVNERSIWRDIGQYRLATEVSWMSVGKAQLEYAASALKNFRSLVEQLATVDPAQMSNDEKLAFWINLYNALIMHIYLAYGVPRSDIKLFSLMKKACYTVGNQSFSAADIEFVLLKMKPPAHRPQIALTLALHKFKLSEEHRKYSLDCSEPLALFGLSYGMYSCPAVRIFTAGNVQEELKNCMKDYIQASVGINEKGKLLVPKLLHSFAKGVVEDSLLVDWICRHLTADQASAVRDAATPHQKQRLLRARSFGIIPFNSRFRYLFLLRNKTPPKL